ncbi:MAG: MJ1255/VC2487 family glycosyltransferase [Patescibacteria group bacterium]
MAKIIYGVSGQGFGHSTRSREILRYLVSKGHQVLVFTYGQALFFLQEEFAVYEIPGLGLSYKNNELSYFDTIYKNTLQLARQSKNWKKILNKFRDFNPDLVITDFESLSAVLAKLQRAPLISIDNQHQITNTKIDLPLKYRKDLLADKLVIKSMVWGAKYYLVTTFFKTLVNKKNTFLFPPILRKEILDLKPQKQDYILVYQNSNFDHIVNQLRDINQKFVVFGLSKEGVEGNIEFKNYDSHQWLNYLANCRAIIGTAGLSLITESLHLAKPYLAVPVKKQIEQVINAYYLEKMGYGLSCAEFTKKNYWRFMENLPTYDKNLEKYNKADNSAIFHKLDEIIGYWS